MMSFMSPVAMAALVKNYVTEGFYWLLRFRRNVQNAAVVIDRIAMTVLATESVGSAHRLR